MERIIKIGLDLFKVPLEKYTEIFNENNLHRFNNEMASIFYAGVQDIKIKYDGFVSNIWLNRPSSNNRIVKSECEKVVK